MSARRTRDETIEIGEGDYVVAMQIARALPPPLHPRQSATPAPTSTWAGLKGPVLVAFTAAFFATAIAGILATLL